MVEIIATALMTLSGILLIPAAIMSSASSAKVFRYLEKVHPSIWAQLGRPSMFYGYTVSSPPVRFLTLRTYLETPDKELWRLGQTARYWFHAAAWLFMALLISGLLLATLEDL